MPTEGETICALSSGTGRAGVAVIRLSGPGALPALSAFVGGDPPSARVAGLRNLKHPATGALLDQGLVLAFPAPASFTGEDMAELHVHGGRAVVASIIDALLSLPGLRLAEPGEFVSRAFANGKLDLTQVEGLADLINAETEAQSRQALTEASGALRALYDSWRTQLLRARALIEAGLDFSDEADVGDMSAAESDGIVGTLIGEIGPFLDNRRGERLREGFRVVLAGPPNAGKSSLLNALARRDVAIVSEEAGTTRDVIEVHLELDGLPVILTDTAGIREPQGRVEAEGVRRALDRAAHADLVLWLVDATAPQWTPPERLAGAPAPVLAVLNKTDLTPPDGNPGAIAISAKTGAGLEQLVDRLSGVARDALGGQDGGLVVTRARQRQELKAALGALREAQAIHDGPEIQAEALRKAAHHLGRLTGRIDVEDVLGAIFSEFCIGK